MRGTLSPHVYRTEVTETVFASTTIVKETSGFPLQTTNDQLTLKNVRNKTTIYEARIGRLKLHDTAA